MTPPAPDEPMTDTTTFPEQRAQCGHSHIERKSEDYKYEGPDVPNPDPDSPHVGLRHGATLTRDWWECRDCKTHFAPAPYLASLSVENRAMRKDQHQLLRFAGRALTECRVQEIGDWDGGSLQEALVECGLLVAIDRVVPCGEARCRCLDDGYAARGDEVCCYPFSDLGHLALDAASAPSRGNT